MHSQVQVQEREEPMHREVREKKVEVIIKTKKEEFLEPKVEPKEEDPAEEPQDDLVF